MDPPLVRREHLVSGSRIGHSSMGPKVDDLPAPSRGVREDDDLDIEKGLEVSGQFRLDIICEENSGPNSTISSDWQGVKTERPEQISSQGDTTESVNHQPDGPVKGDDDDDDGIDNQSECRVCHLSFGESTSSETMKLGCHCKDGLGLAHRNCAEAWFNIKGDRVCEICGVVAENIAGVEDSGFMEQWNDGGPPQNPTTAARRPRDLWQGLSLCNFLLACMIVIFILLWLFRISIVLH